MVNDYAYSSAVSKLKEPSENPKAEYEANSSLPCSAIFYQIPESQTWQHKGKWTSCSFFKLKLNLNAFRIASFQFILVLDTS